jgi:hypothetical protein
MHAHLERTEKYEDAEDTYCSHMSDPWWNILRGPPAPAPDPAWLASWLQEYYSEELKEPPPPPAPPPEK